MFVNTSSLANHKYIGVMIFKDTFVNPMGVEYPNFHYTALAETLHIIQARYVGRFVAGDF